MRPLLFAAGLILAVLQTLAATRVASVSGNWNDTATWGGAAVPVTGDWAQINGDIVVTIPTGVSAACLRVYIGLTNNSTGTSTLIINGTLTMDASGQVRIGDQTTASRDGILTLGPDGVLTGGASSSIYFNQGKMLSTATKANPAKVTGSLALTTLATGPKQYVDLAHVSFQNTGTMAWLLQNTLGAFSSQFVVQNCVFQGNAAITIGSTTTPNTALLSFVNIDVREGTGGKSFTIQRIAGGTTPPVFTGNTFSITTSPYNIYFKGVGGMSLSSCVLYNTYYNFDSSSGGHTISDTIFASTGNTPTAINSTDQADGITVEDCLFVSFPTGDNMRGWFPATGSTGGTGNNIIRRSYLEGPVTAGKDKPDIVVARGDALPFILTNNIIRGAGEFIVGGRVAAWSLPITVKNNTLVGLASSSVMGVGHIYVPEGVSNSGVVTIANNLVLGNAKVGDTCIGGSTPAQTIAYSDFNNFYNIATPYEVGATVIITAGNTGKTVPAANDGVDDPKFFDSTRSFARWAYFFAGIETEAAGIDLLLTKNGYRGTPYFDQNGAPCAYTNRQVLDWVAYGFSPTNLALRAAGAPADGSPDVGAMPVRKPAGNFF